MFTYGGVEAAQYPIALYAARFRRILTFAVPPPAWPTIPRWPSWQARSARRAGSTGWCRRSPDSPSRHRLRRLAHRRSHYASTGS